MKGLGWHNSACWYELDGRRMFHVVREDRHMVFGATPQFLRRSVGFVGFSDGWQDLMENFRMDWEFRAARTATLPSRRKWTFRATENSSSAWLLAKSAKRFDQAIAIARGAVRSAARQLRSQWQRATPAAQADVADPTGDEGRLYRVSRLILLAHEDKFFPER